MAVVVAAASGFDLGCVWQSQDQLAVQERSLGGYYIGAAQAGVKIADRLGDGRGCKRRSSCPGLAG
jgi:hypothetical protein